MNELFENADAGGRSAALYFDPERAISPLVFFLQPNAPRVKTVGNSGEFYGFSRGSASRADCFEFKKESRNPQMRREMLYRAAESIGWGVLSRTPHIR
jgi:hypothetical protein